MQKISLAFACALAAAASVASAQTTVFSEDFESANTTADLTTGGKWTLSATPFGSISSTQARGTKSFYSPYTDNGTGGIAAEIRTNDVSNPGGLQASASSPVTLTYWLYDAQGVQSSARRGVAIAAYTGGSWGSGTLRNYLGFGVYSTTTNGKYNHRAVNGFTTATWKAGTGPNRTVGWHKMELIAGGPAAGAANAFVTEVDDTANGGNTFTIPPRNAAPDNGWNSLRVFNFAGTAGGDTTFPTANFYFDDITVTANTSVPVTMSGIWVD